MFVIERSLCYARINRAFAVKKRTFNECAQISRERNNNLMH